MNIKSFLVMKNILSELLISLSRSSDRSDKNFMILVIVAKMRLINWTQLVFNGGWGSDQKDSTKQNSYSDAWNKLCKNIVMSSLNCVRLQKEVIYWLYKKRKHKNNPLNLNCSKTFDFWVMLESESESESLVPNHLQLWKRRNITVLTQRCAEDPLTEQNLGFVSLYGMRGHICTHMIVFHNHSANHIIFLVE